jgi:hypothetical protein
MSAAAAPPPPPAPPVSQYFTMIESGSSCEANGAGSITTLAGCSAAAAALGLDDTTAKDDGYEKSPSFWPFAPPYCYLRYRNDLRINSAGTNTGDCGVLAEFSTHVRSPCICYHYTAGTFNDRAELHKAVSQWVYNPSTTASEHGTISGWDTSRVDDMSELFNIYLTNSWEKSYDFIDISAWDTSRVRTMFRTFGAAGVFNSELLWDTSMVTGPYRALADFNSELAWDTSKVTNMAYA